MRPSEQQRGDTAVVQRQQLGGALLLGVLILAGIVLRAVHGHVLPAGWWRP